MNAATRLVGFSLHLTSGSDHYPGAAVSVAYLHVADADALAAEWGREDAELDGLRAGLAALAWIRAR